MTDENSGAINSSDTDTTRKLLQSYINRIENLEDTKKDIASDIKDVYAEVESNGFDKKALKAVITRRKKERAELESIDANVELYESLC